MIMTRSSRKTWVPALALGIALIVSGCQQVQTQESTGPISEDVTSAPIGDQTIVEGGDLVMALSAEPDRLDPTTSGSLYTRYVMETMCQKLYDIDATGAIVPLLATELPEVSADGLTVTIPVRDDATFADGTEFNAEAVVTSLDRHLNKEDSTRAGELGPITDIAAADPTHVEVTYSEPFAPLAASLADRAGMIMSPAALEESGDDFGDNPVCVGPFKFVKRVPQTSISVERDPLYYDAESVHLDTITYRIITDASIREANLRSGDVQIADSMSTQDIDGLLDSEDLGVLQVGSLGYQGLTINVGNTDGTGAPPGTIDTPLAQNADVRQALSLAVDREELVRTVFSDWYDPACSAISPKSPYTSALSEACPEYDPEGAKKLLEDAGVTTPYEIEIQVSNNPDTIRYAQALQAMVTEGGFELKIVPVEYSTLLDVQQQGDFEMIALGWSGRIDPHGNLFNFHITGGGSNYTGYSSEKTDELLTNAASTNDVAERAELYGQVVEQLQQDNPMVYLYRARSLTAYSTTLAGIANYADGVVRLSNAAFVETE